MHCVVSMFNLQADSNISRDPGPGPGQVGWTGADTVRHWHHYQISPPHSGNIQSAGQAGRGVKQGTVALNK